MASRNYLLYSSALSIYLSTPHPPNPNKRDTMHHGSQIDPYAALGVSHDASPATIRLSYKKLMLQCHPEKLRDEAQRAEKAQQFQNVNEAYEILIDSQRRRKYDMELARKTHGGTAASLATSSATAESFKAIEGGKAARNRLEASHEQKEWGRRVMRMIRMRPEREKWEEWDRREEWEEQMIQMIQIGIRWERGIWEERKRRERKAQKETAQAADLLSVKIGRPIKIPTFRNQTLPASPSSGGHHRGFSSLPKGDGISTILPYSAKRDRKWLEGEKFRLHTEAPGCHTNTATPLDCEVGMPNPSPLPPSSPYIHGQNVRAGPGLLHVGHYL